MSVLLKLFSVFFCTFYFPLILADQCTMLCGLQCGSAYDCSVSGTQCKCSLKPWIIVMIVIGILLCCCGGKKARDVYIIQPHNQAIPLR